MKLNILHIKYEIFIIYAWASPNTKYSCYKVKNLSNYLFGNKCLSSWSIIQNIHW